MNKFNAMILSSYRENTISWVIAFPFVIIVFGLFFYMSLLIPLADHIFGRVMHDYIMYSIFIFFPIITVGNYFYQVILALIQVKELENKNLTLFIVFYIPIIVSMISFLTMALGSQS